MTPHGAGLDGPSRSWRRLMPAWLDASPFPSAAMDASRTIVYANRAALDLVGLPRERVVGRRPHEFISPRDHGYLSSQILMRAKGHVEPYVVGVRLGDGSDVERLMIPQVIVDEIGRFNGSLAIILDPSEVAARITSDAEPARGGLARGSVRVLDDPVASAPPADPVSHLLRLRRTHAGLRSLSPREWDVVVSILRGRRVRNISIEFDISEHTVRTYLKSIFRKLEVVSQSDLVDWLLSLESPAHDDTRGRP